LQNTGGKGYGLTTRYRKDGTKIIRKKEVAIRDEGRGSEGGKWPAITIVRVIGK